MKRIVALLGFALLAAMTLAPPAAHADDIERAFCYVAQVESLPNTNVYAKTREEADRKRPQKDLTFCKSGPCDYAGEIAGWKENCND